MDHGTRDDLTALLEAARAGGEDAKDRLVRAAYGELRRMAAGFMRRERTDHTLQPSALVNEAVIRLLDGGALVKAQDRRHLFAAAAQAMRQAWSTTPAPAARPSARRSGAGAVGRRARLLRAQHLDVIALHEAIDRLIALDERQGQVVVLRFFAGLSISEVAEGSTSRRRRSRETGESPGPGSAANSGERSSDARALAAGLLPLHRGPSVHPLRA